MADKEIRARLALSYLDGKGVGPVTARKLLSFFGSASAVFEAKVGALQEAGANAKAAGAVAGFHETKKIDDALAALEKVGAHVLCVDDEAYPASLRRLNDAPPVLYVHGEITPADSLALAVIGTRKPTPYGLRVTRDLCRKIAECNVTIVSGLARGIDAEGHSGALDTPGGRTIAVLGSGVDVIYPKEHAGLAGRVSRNGAVISEFFPGTPPTPNNFPRRNRLIAGLACGVMVVEAAEKSGTMITVEDAHRQGKPVFGVPGPIDSPVSMGVHRLIRDGAVPVFEAADVLENLLPEFVRREELPPPARLDVEGYKRSLGLTGDAQLVVEALTLEPQHVDEVARATGLSAQRLLTILLELELRGAVNALPGKLYVLNAVAR